MWCKRYLLIFVLLFCWHYSLHTAEGRPLSDLRGDPINEFPVTVSVETFKGELTQASGTYKFFLPTQDGKYLPINSDIADKLTRQPEVYAPKGIQVIVRNSKCILKELHVRYEDSVLSIPGAVMEWAVDIVPDVNLPPAEYEVVLLFTAVTTTFYILGVDNLVSPAEVQLKVQVWDSHDSKSQFLNRYDKERQDSGLQGQGAPNGGVQRMQHSTLRKSLDKTLSNLPALDPRVIGAVGLLGLLLGVITVLNRKWLWPDAIVILPANNHIQKRRVVAAKIGDEYEDPGTVLETLWAKNRRGQRQRIKVEFFIATEGEEEFHSDQRQKIVTTHHEFSHDGKLSATALTNLRLDLLVSVGASVSPGRYLAEGSRGTVLVQVLRDSK